jgi:hypothetical protein
VRADFNTLDNPFAWSVRPDEIGETPAAGVHFVVFNPTSDDFHRNRRAMDGVLPGGKIPFLRRVKFGSRRGHLGPPGTGMPRSVQILRARRKSISRWRGTAVDRSASKPQKLWLPPSRKSRAP